MQTINNYIYKIFHYNTSSVLQVLQGEWIITVQKTDIKIKINSKTFLPDKILLQCIVTYLSLSGRECS